MNAKTFCSIAGVAAVILGVTVNASQSLADPRCGAAAAIRVGAAPPPPLPEAAQPPMPGYGYIWTPGYWAWNGDLNDYYWVLGAWVRPPAIGLLWTPAYWAWTGGVYLFNPGYWGPHVGFYGGIRYGFGYWGHGYDGGYWRGNTIYYNRAYNNIGQLHVNALYERRVAYDRTGPRTSFNGGPGGVSAVPTAEERAAGREAHIGATADQGRRYAASIADPTMRAGVNHGRPTHGVGAPSTIARTGGMGHGVAERHTSGFASRRPHTDTIMRHSPSHGRYAPSHEAHPQWSHPGPARLHPAHAGPGNGPVGHAPQRPAHERPNGR